MNVITKKENLIGELMYNALGEQNFSIRKAAKLLGVSYSYLNKVMRAKTNTPSINFLDKVAFGLGIPFVLLFYAAGYFDKRSKQGKITFKEESQLFEAFLNYRSNSIPHNELDIIYNTYYGQNPDDELLEYYINYGYTDALIVDEIFILFFEIPKTIENNAVNFKNLRNVIQECFNYCFIEEKNDYKECVHKKLQIIESNEPEEKNIESHNYLEDNDILLSYTYTDDKHAIVQLIIPQEMYKKFGKEILDLFFNMQNTANSDGEEITFYSTNISNGNMLQKIQLPIRVEEIYSENIWELFKQIKKEIKRTQS